MSNKGKKPDEVEFNTLVGKNIRHLRKWKKLTQTQIGNAIGVSFQQVQKYEKGANGLHSYALYKVSHKVFNMKMDQFTDPNMIEKHTEFVRWQEDEDDKFQINRSIEEQELKQRTIDWIKTHTSEAKEIIGIAESEKKPTGPTGIQAARATGDPEVLDYK